MARFARIVVPELPHHVTQRGNRQSNIFITDDDRLFYLYLLDRFASKYGLDLQAYCLMTNHVHLIAVPLVVDALANTLRDAHTIYAQRFNKRENLSGHLWQGRFYSCVMDEFHSLAAVRYVERNPVRAGIASMPEKYRWSSAASHCGLTYDPYLSREVPHNGNIGDWSGWLADEDRNTTDTIRRQTHTGRPCGSDDFIEKVETLLGRNVRPKQRGRKIGDRLRITAKSGTDYEFPVGPMVVGVESAN